jgi:hypothetical protein
LRAFFRFADVKGHLGTRSYWARRNEGYTRGTQKTGGR